MRWSLASTGELWDGAGELWYRGAVTLQLFDTTADFWYFGFSPVYHPTPLPVSAALTGYFPEIFVDPPPIFKHFSKFHDFYITHIMKLYSYILLHSIYYTQYTYIKLYKTVVIYN